MGNLQSAIDELATEDLQLAGPVAVAEGLVDQFGQIERLQADALRRLAFVDASGAWADDGSLSPQAWLRRQCRMAPGAAAERVRVARRLEGLPETRDAFGAGDIGYAHVRLIAEALNTSERCRHTAADAEPPRGRRTRAGPARPAARRGALAPHGRRRRVRRVRGLRHALSPRVQQAARRRAGRARPALSGRR